MGYIEADVAVVYGRVVEGFRVRYSRDLYFETLVVPGFSDGHAHPQVVDAGLRPGARWGNSYEWLESRRLVVDEAAVRADIAVSSRLARLVLMRSLLEGTTLVALTGRVEANVLAWLSLESRPRAVFMPTVMDRRGWPSVDSLRRVVPRIRDALNDDLSRLGIFIHSLGTTSRGSVREALRLASSMGLLVGMHLSEGVSEAAELESIVGPAPPAKVVAVHCIEDEETPSWATCISCPASNLLLYGRTRRSLGHVEGFGSDWPLLIGSVARHLGLVTYVYGERLEPLLYRLTIGGYRAYNVDPTGDMAGYDYPLRAVLEGRVTPTFVSVAGQPVVVEGELVDKHLSLPDVESLIREAIDEVVEAYGDGGRPYTPPLEELLEAARRATARPRAP